MKRYQQTIFDREQDSRSGWMNVYPSYKLGMIYDSRGEADEMCKIVGKAIYRIRVKLKEKT